MYPKVLPRPPYLNDYHGSVHVRIRYDNRDLCLQQACGPVELPDDLPVAPLVIFEARGDSGQLIFPAQAWDYEGDKGRGGWAMYDEKLFPVPQSEPEEPKEEPKKVLDFSASTVIPGLASVVNSNPETEPEKGETETTSRPGEDLDTPSTANEDEDVEESGSSSQDK